MNNFTFTTEQRPPYRMNLLFDAQYLEVGDILHNYFTSVQLEPPTAVFVPEKGGWRSLLCELQRPFPR